MYPILWQWGSFIVPAWHFFFLIAAFAAYSVLRYLTKHYHHELLPHLNPFYVTTYLGALVGARVLSIIIEDESFRFSEILSMTSLTFYGGFIGSLIFGTTFIFSKKLRFALFWDLTIPPLFLALAIGRIGCFLNGDDYGIPIPQNMLASKPWWAVTFPNHSQPIARYPVQLMESSIVFLLAMFLLISFKHLHTRKIGLVGSLGVLSYAIFRFFLEYYRDDERGWFIKNALSSSQGISLVMGSAIVIFYLFSFIHKKILH